MINMFKVFPRLIEHCHVKTCFNCIQLFGTLVFKYLNIDDGYDFESFHLMNLINMALKATFIRSFNHHTCTEKKSQRKKFSKIFFLISLLQRYYNIFFICTLING